MSDITLCCGPGSPSVISVDGPVTGIWQDPTSGVVVIAGTFTHVNGVSRIGFAIFDNNLNLLPRQYGPGSPGVGSVSQVAFDSSSNIYVAGSFQGWDSLGDSFYDTSAFQGLYTGIVKLSPDGGTPDGYVGTPSLFVPPLVTISGQKGVLSKSSATLFDSPSAIVAAGSTMVLGGGSFTGYGTNTVQGVAIINHDGSFNAGTGTALFCSSLIGDGSGGWYGTEAPEYYFHNDAVWPYASPVGGMLWAPGNKLCPQGSDVIVYSGGFTGAKVDTGSGWPGPDSLITGGIVRIAGGAPDASFGSWNLGTNGGGGWGYATVGGAHTGGANVIVCDPATGKLYCTQPTDGAALLSWTTYGGNLGAGGIACNSNLLRLNSDGTLDTAWTGELGGGSGAYGNAICILANGYILVGGTFTQSGQHGSSLTTANYLTLFNSSGTKVW
jgi:hypothetical protein